MKTYPPELLKVMEEAVARCVTHVEAGGLPFVGVVVDDKRVISTFGVNQVRETRDPTAHAEIVAMRDAMSAQGRTDLTGAVLLATGEPCGLCYRFAIDHGIETIYVAIDRDTVAEWGFDYRSSYSSLEVSDERRAGLYHPLPVEHGNEPFIRHLQTPGLTERKDLRSHNHLN
ncbi:nucleoside deaminase [Arthrobacter sp. YN]|uniref:nucleoside deaminase n=1 Tax=Arthrobacter sp. YN TaxID=2020486 RepID=UPI000B5FEF8A|nr:nucleoside deaminase [Arthrobacter sp. YN]ASN18916.1 cytosine deaminase [Arthrobacter sp. YN]